MKNKGFTLVELLAVIIILAIISTIGAIGISKTVNTSKNKIYEQQVANIIKAAKEWSLENSDKLPEGSSNVICISLGTLNNSGILTEVPTNPINGSKMAGAVTIKCTDTNCTSYVYKYDETKTTGCY